MTISPLQALLILALAALALAWAEYERYRK